VTFTTVGTVTRTAAQTTAATGANTTFTDATALATTAYVYRVYAVGLGGTSAAATVNVAAVAAPATPTTLTAAVRSTAASVVLSWVDASTTETSFRVEKSLDNATWTTVASVTRTAAQTTATGAAVTYTDATASASVTSYYRVFAVGLGGDSAAATNVLTMAAMIPGAPIGLAAAARSTAASVVLTWVDNSTFETSYLIERSANAGSTWLPLASVARTAAQTLANPGTATTYTDASALAGSAYQYRLTASGLGGTGPATAALNVAAIAAPTAPTIALVRNGANNQVQITDTSTVETGFVVQRAPVTGTVVTPAAGTTGTAMTGGTVGAWTTVTTLTRTAAQTAATGVTLNSNDTTAAALVAGTTWAYRVVATGLAAGNGSTDTSTVVYVKR
jgi:hypothetical protein